MADRPEPPDPPETAITEVLELLDEFLASPGRRREVGQRAALLWWQLDGSGHCGATETPAWEQALLGLAAWHTGDDRLARQRTDEAEATELRRRLLAAHGPA